MVKELEKMQKYFLWKKSTLKIKHETNCKRLQRQWLKDVDISWKIVSLCSWVRRLCGEYFHE